MTHSRWRQRRAAWAVSVLAAAVTLAGTALAGARLAPSGWHRAGWPRAGWPRAGWHRPGWHREQGRRPCGHRSRGGRTAGRGADPERGAGGEADHRAAHHHYRGVRRLRVHRPRHLRCLAELGPGVPCAASQLRKARHHHRDAAPGRAHGGPAAAGQPDPRRLGRPAPLHPAAAGHLPRAGSRPQHPGVLPEQLRPGAGQPGQRDELALSAGVLGVRPVPAGDRVGHRQRLGGRPDRVQRQSRQARHLPDHRDDHRPVPAAAAHLRRRCQRERQGQGGQERGLLLPGEPAAGIAPGTPGRARCRPCRPRRHSGIRRGTRCPT